jgi:hypothetical protein
MITITMDRQPGNLPQMATTPGAKAITGDHVPESPFVKEPQGSVFSGYGQKAFCGCWTITFDSDDR